MSTHKSYLTLLSQNERDRVSIFRNIPVNKQASVVLSLSKGIQKELLSILYDDEIAVFLRYADPDQATDVIQNMLPKRRKRIIALLESNVKTKVEYLLKFNPSSAAGLMSLQYLQLDVGTTFSQVSKIIQMHEKRTGKFPALLVVKDGFLLGELKGHELVLHKGTERIAPFVESIPSIKYDAKQQDVFTLFRNHPHSKVAVLDEDDSIMGIIYADDLVAHLGKQSGKSLYEFAGVSVEETIFNSPWTKVKYRYKWLVINIFHAFIASAVIGYFHDTLAALVVLAAYMPIVAGMGGNAATQTLAVVVRGLALNKIDLSVARRLLFHEMVAGAANGVITGVIVGIIAMLVNQSPILGLVLTIAMMLNLVVAAFFGVVVPLLLYRLGKDPASSATIFITTATDVFGFFVFLSLASLFLL